MARIGARPVPPATISSGVFVSRRKKEPWGPLKVTSSPPTFATFEAHSEHRPPGTILIRNSSSSESGALEKEYERVSSLPGMVMFTYCPGR